MPNANPELEAVARQFDMSVDAFTLVLQHLAPLTRPHLGASFEAYGREWLVASHYGDGSFGVVLLPVGVPASDWGRVSMNPMRIVLHPVGQHA